MELIRTTTKDWAISENSRNIKTAEGIELNDALAKDLCQQLSIPATLINVDAKFGTHTLLDVTKATTPVVTLVRDEESGDLAVLNPKAQAVDDKQYDEFVEQLSLITGITPEKSKKGLRATAIFSNPTLDTDNYLGDVFSKNMSLNRNPNGGVTLSTGLLRLACTNGMMVHDRQYTMKFIEGNLDEATMKVFADQVTKFDIPNYLRGIFTYNGEPLSASVENYIDMRRCLARIASDELADMLYPMQPIEDFYNAQGIDITKINTKYLHTLPSGLSYYECLNFLTNGAKAAEQTLANKIAVASFATPRRISQLKNTDLHYTGMPQFSRSEVLTRMGDSK